MKSNTFFAQQNIHSKKQQQYRNSWCTGEKRIGSKALQKQGKEHWQSLSIRFAVGGVGGLTPLVEDDLPSLLTIKFGLGSNSTPQKGRKSKFVVKSL